LINKNSFRQAPLKAVDAQLTEFQQLNVSTTKHIQPIKELELKMFHQTQTARKPPSACTAVTPNSDGMVPSAAG